MTQLRRPNEKANAIVMAEGIKEVHAMIEPTLNLLLNSSIPLVGVEPRANVYDQISVFWIEPKKRFKCLKIRL